MGLPSFGSSIFATIARHSSTGLGRADPGERIVTVEDTAELLPSCPHLVRLEARRANAEGAGAISLSELVRQALRMRPDRIVVGDCRGAEVTDLLAALNTGHSGGCGTVHANATASGDVLDIYEAAGLPKPSHMDLWPAFVKQTQEAPNPHIAIGALRALIHEKSAKATGTTRCGRGRSPNGSRT